MNHLLPAFRQSGLLHISVAIGRVRNSLARFIATKEQVFSSDMSLEVDRLNAENERLREQIEVTA